MKRRSGVYFQLGYVRHHMSIRVTLNLTQQFKIHRLNIGQERHCHTVQESPSTVYTAFCRFEFIAWARRPHYVTSSDQGRGHDVALFNALNIFGLVARWEGEC